MNVSRAAEEKNSVLIVDDDTSSLMELSRILLPLYTVYMAKDGVSALKIAIKSLPDIIIMDIIMPDMSGFEVLAELGKDDRTKDMPVIFITGISDSDKESEGLALGAVDYICKPFDAKVVEHRVRRNIQIINLRRDLESAAAAADSANQAKSAFLANISHELRTPMNVIVGLTGFLLEEDDLAQTAKDYLQKINTAGVTLTGLISDILDISKIESGKFTLTPVQYDLANLLNDVVSLSVVHTYNKPITFKLDIGGDLLSTVCGDDLRVKQILINLLSNAFKYTKAGTVELSVSCAREGADFVRLFFAISDTGIGMRKEDLDKLFDEYNQVDTQANRMIEGTGLGLFISKGLAEAMDGKISAESEYGKGSVFRVSVRQGFVSEACIDSETADNLKNLRYEDRRKTAERMPVRPDLSWAKVLVVDDNPTNLTVARHMLGKYKMRVDCLTNGRDAIERIRLGVPVYDAVFMDHMMPDMDGIETARLIRALGTDYAVEIPVIALTANAVTGVEQLFYNEGFQAFLTKPINITRLDAVIRKWVMKE